MANEIRIRRNNIGGVTTDNPLSNVATTINSPGFVDLPTVDATSHLILVLDPLELAGPAEIVRVTAHTAAASSCTIVRGAEGSAARTHTAGTTWYHGAVASDTTEVLTSGTRPTTPYEGQFIYETDTNKFVGFGGVDWAPRDSGGALGYAQVVANQTGIGTVEVDLTSLTVTVTVGSGRRVKITGKVDLATTTGTGAQTELRIKEGATQLQRGKIESPTNTSESQEAFAILTPSAGVHTYKLSLITGNGTVTMVATSELPAFILVEDIGAA